MTSAAEYVDEWSGDGDTGWFGSSFVKKVSHGVSSVAKTVAKPVSSVVTTVAKPVSTVAQTAMKPAAMLAKSPIWDIAKTGAAFIPGVGQAVSSGMAAAAAIGRGESMKDVALASARGAIPGGAVGQAAFDVAVGAVKGQRLDKAALGALREQVPGGELGRAAFDAGVALASGEKPATVLSAAQHKVMRSALAAAGRVTSQAVPLSLPDVGRTAGVVAQALAKDTVSRGTRIGQLASRLSATPVDARKAAAALITRHAGRGIDWRDIGEGETLDVAARRLGVALPANLAAIPSLGRGAATKIHRMPPVGLSRRLALGIFERGSPGLRKAILAHGLLSELARNAGELTADGKWTIKYGDTGSSVAKAVTGDSTRWKELPAVNPGMVVKTVTNSNGTKTTLLVPWNVGQKVNLPPSWVAATLPQLTVPTVPSPTPASSPSTTTPTVAGGPPFPSPPSLYPDGYPSAIYVVVSGDYGAKIAEKITGSQARWKELLAANPSTADKTYGMKLYAGQKLQLPPNWVKPAQIAPAIPIPTGPTLPSASELLGQLGATSPGLPQLPASPQASDPLPYPTDPWGPAPSSSAPETITVAGTPEQVAIVQIELGSFYKAHPEATWSMQGEPYGSSTNEYDGIWGPRSTAALAGFQAFWNKAHAPKLPTNGLPDAMTLAALQQQVAADVASSAPKLPGLPGPGASSSTGPLPPAPPPVAQPSTPQAQPTAAPAPDKKSGGAGVLLALASLLALLK